VRRDVSSLALAGLVRFSTVDFPGRLAAVLFTAGCPLRCRYCHNPHLRRLSVPRLDWAATVAWLRRRMGLLDGVVFSGGEPTVQPGLPAALAEVRALGFATGLHTAGVAPDRLRQMLPLLDWVGLDVKAPFDRYGAVTGRPGAGARARRALDAVLDSGVGYEIRTTVHADLLSPDDLLGIAAELRARGVGAWVLQEFRPEGCADAALVTRSAPLADDGLLAVLARLVPRVEVRRAG
jgi:pyruvate formate lyase activating enzyme